MASTSVRSGRCEPPRYGSLSMNTSPGRGVALAHGAHGLGHRAEVHGDVRRLRDHAAVAHRTAPPTRRAARGCSARARRARAPRPSPRRSRDTRAPSPRARADRTCARSRVALQHPAADRQRRGHPSRRHAAAWRRRARAPPGPAMIRRRDLSRAPGASSRHRARRTDAACRAPTTSTGASSTNPYRASCSAAKRVASARAVLARPNGTSSSCPCPTYRARADHAGASDVARPATPRAARRASRASCGLRARRARRITLASASRRSAAIARPSALSTPANGGTSTRRMPS